MGITTKIVQTMLLTEIVLFILLLLPIPSKRQMLAKLTSSFIFKGIKHILLAVYAMIVLLFLDSLFKTSKGNENTYYLYHAERNLYLTGFTLFLAIIFYSFTKLLLQIKIDEEKAGILKKQALNQKDHVEKIIKSSKEKDAKIIELEEKVLKSEVLMKQVKNNQDEYFKLLDKYNKLVTKISGETKKSV